MTPLEAIYVQLTDTELGMMVDSAWRQAAREWQESRAECATHGSAAHSSVCLMLADSARSAEAHWNRLVTEQRRRGARLQPTMDPSTHVDLRGHATPERFVRS
jgi:hypothetical protein